MPGPLQGITVIDCSTVIAGPYATHILSEMGADVIKIEPPEGDIMRAAGPARHEGMGAAFLNCNRNKRSIVLNLKNADDRQRLFDMVKTADVFIHNMRSAACSRLGLDSEALLKINPRLVYCAIVGYGQDGPYRDRPAYDDIIQAASGWAGMAQRMQGEPCYAPTIAADKTSAVYAVSAINAALFYREKTGAGQYVEVPMFEVMASFLLVEQLGGMTFLPPLGKPGYARLLSQHRRPYRTRDGFISVMPYTGKHWIRFFNEAGMPEMAADERLANPAERAAMIDELYERLGAALLQRTTAEWMSLLPAADIPCSAVNSVESLFEDPHLQEVGFFVPVNHPTEGTIIATRPPIRFSESPCERQPAASVRQLDGSAHEVFAPQGPAPI